MCFSGGVTNFYVSILNVDPVEIMNGDECKRKSEVDIYHDD